MKAKLFDNLWLKIAALVLAFIVWFAVLNINDPRLSRTISSIPVTVSNSSYVESLGMSCKLIDGADTVSVVVTGHRSVIEKLSREDVRAVADLTQIVNMESDPIMVPVTVSVTGVPAENITVTPGSISISLEEMQSQEFVVTTTTGESRPNNKSYQVGQTTVSPDSVIVTGPASLIQIIDRVVAPVDVSILTEDKTVTSKIEIYDKNGSKFTDTQMDSLKFTKSDGTVSVFVDLWRVLSDVELAASVGGTPADGYRVGDVTVNPSVTSVAATDEAIEAIIDAGNSIEIPAELLDIDGLDDDFTARIELAQILPDGVRLSDNANTASIVTVEIVPLDSRTFELPVSGIERVNLPDDLAVIFRTERVRVRVQGGEGLDDLREEDLSMSIDFDGMGEGTYDDVPVSVTVPEEYTVVADPTVSLEIAEVADSTASESDGS